MILPAMLCTYVRSIYPYFSRYRKQELSEQTCFRALKISGNGNSKVFDRRTKLFHEIVLL